MLFTVTPEACEKGIYFSFAYAIVLGEVSDDICYLFPVRLHRQVVFIEIKIFVVVWMNTNLV